MWRRAHWKGHLRGCSHEKTRTSASFIPGWLLDFVPCLHVDWVISYCVYMIVMKVHFMLIKYKCETKSYTLRMRYPFLSTSRPISHRNEWSFRVYMILLRNFVPEWTHADDSRQHDSLWWYHVNKYRATRGNWSELARARKLPRCHVNAP